MKKTSMCTRLPLTPNPPRHHDANEQATRAVGDPPEFAESQPSVTLS